MLASTDVGFLADVIFQEYGDVAEYILQANLGSSKNLYIVEAFQRAATTEEVTKDFQATIAFCKKQQLINPRLKKRLDRIRSKRNEIHLQLRTSHTRSYTKAHIDQLADTTRKLIQVLVSI